MNRYLKISISAFIFILFGCPDYVEDPNPPAPPVFVEKTYPADLIEKGIGAYNFNTENPDKNSIQLMWHPNTEDDLAGYKLYRALEIVDELTDFEVIETIDLSTTMSGRDTFFVDTTPAELKRYYYYLTAYDLAGNNSLPSDSISYKLLKKPHAFPIAHGTTSRNLTFRWEEHQLDSEFPQNSVIRINDEDDLTVWVCLFYYPFNGYSFNFAPNGENVNEEVVIAFNGIEGYLPPGRYFWKVEALRLGNGISTDADMDYVGAESDWVEFILVE